MSDIKYFTDDYGVTTVLIPCFAEEHGAGPFQKCVGIQFGQANIPVSWRGEAVTVTTDDTSKDWYKAETDVVLLPEKSPGTFYIERSVWEEVQKIIEKERR